LADRVSPPKKLIHTIWITEFLFESGKIQKVEEEERKKVWGSTEISFDLKESRYSLNRLNLKPIDKVMIRAGIASSAEAHRAAI